jgi:hypothetical protein
MKYGEQDDGPLPHVYARYTARGLIGGKWQNENALTINDIVKARSIMSVLQNTSAHLQGKLHVEVACVEPPLALKRFSNGRYSSRYNSMQTLTSSCTVHARMTAGTKK